MPVVTGPSARTAGRPVLGWDDHRPFLGAATDQPMDRLVRVRADGTLVPVGGRSIQGVRRVYCFVHGWAPGSHAAANLIRAQTGRLPRAWDPGIVDMFGISLADAYLPLLTAIAQRDPHAAVLWFSWVDESATPGQVFAAGQSLSHTQINGARLAMALVGACGGHLPRVQLIGHSHGSVVACHAALALPSTPDQLTLLDCPEDWFSRAGGAAGLLAQLLPRLEPGRGPGQVFVDSYASMFGRAYHRRPGLSEVVDVRVTGGLRRREGRGPAGDAHEYAVDWYAQTVRSADPGCGFGWSVLAEDQASEGGSTGGALDRQALAAGYMVGIRSSPVVTARRRPARTQPRQEVISLGVGELQLSAQRPDVMIAVDLPKGDLVEFDYEITAPGRRSRVEGAVERVLAFSGAAGLIEVPPRGRYLRVPGDRDTAAPVLIQFRLAEPETGTTATVSGLRALHTGTTRNYDPTRSAITFAAVGAAAGCAATLTAQGIAGLIRGRLAKG